MAIEAGSGTIWKEPDPFDWNWMSKGPFGFVLPTRVPLIVGKFGVVPKKFIEGSAPAVTNWVSVEMVRFSDEPVKFVVKKVLS